LTYLINYDIVCKDDCTWIAEVIPVARD